MPFGNHKFKTNKEENKGDIFRFVLAFLAFAVVFGSISLIVILKNNDVSLRDIFAKETTTQSLQSETQTPSELDVKLEGKANFLIYCTDEEKRELYFLHVITADMDNQTFKVYPLNPDGKANNGQKFIDILAKSGYQSLLDAVSEKTGMKIEKYAGSNINTFALAINYLDGLEYDMPERVEYRNDEYTLILAKGKQTIKGETLIKFYRYCKTLGADGLRRQGQITCSMLDYFINSENAENGSTVFKRLLTKINSDSNISYVDAVSSMPMLEALCESKDRADSTVNLIDEYLG